MSSAPESPLGIPRPSLLLERFRRALLGKRHPPIRDLGSLKDSVRADGAFLAQGSSYAYLRARSGTHADRLFRDPGFAAALNLCKWETFAAATADMLVLAEAELRQHHRLPPSVLAELFAQLYEETLSLEPVPEHRRAEGWEMDILQFAGRIEEASRLPRPPLRRIVRNTGERLMRHAPVTEEVRRVDRQMVFNNVEFRFIERLSALRRRLDRERVGRHLESRARDIGRP